MGTTNYSWEALSVVLLVILTIIIGSWIFTHIDMEVKPPHPNDRIFAPK